MLNGIDVSNNNGPVDWSAVAAAGFRFAGIKASGGVQFMDRYYAENLRGCLDHGIVPIPYHFEHDQPSGNGIQEAEHFLSVIGTDLKGYFPPCLDLEIGLGGQEHDWALAFQQTVEAAIGIAPSIYGSSGNLEPWLNNDLRFRRYPLWVAHYTGAAHPWVPHPWETWVIWQYSSTGSVHGVSGACDMNRFNGDEATLQAYVIGAEPAPTPVPTPAQEDEMWQLVSVANSGVSYLCNGTTLLKAGTYAEIGALFGISEEDARKKFRIRYLPADHFVWKLPRVQ